MKKIASILLSVILLASLFSACTPADPSSTATPTPAGGSTPTPNQGGTTEPVTVTVWSWDPNFNIAIMKTAAEKYGNPNVTFDIVEMAKADVEQKLHTVLASNVTTGLPDIVLIEDYNAQKYLRAYPGMFADLTNTINYSDFLPYKVGVMTVDSKIYGIPFDTGSSAFFYRSDVLAEAGFSASDLENITWDRFIEIGKEVKAKTGKVLLSFGKDDGGFMRIMMQSAGSWYFNDDGTSNVATNPVVREALETYKKIADAGIIKSTSGWDEWVGAFNTGEAASVTSGAWIVGSIKAAADQSGKWAVAPTPRLNASSSVNASNLGGSSWYILENAPAKEAAIAFMQDIYCKDIDFYQTILVNNGAICSYIPAQAGSAYAAADQFFGGQKVWEILGNYAKDIPSIDYGMYTYEADAAIMGVIEGVYNGTTSVEDALQAADAQLKNQMQ